MVKSMKRQALPPECDGPLAISSDAKRFADARELVLSERAKSGGIGTLSEKTLHKIMKYYLEPNSDHHEIEYLGSILDVKSENGIFEVQTRGYDKLLPKLKKLLKTDKVTVVCPLAANKTIRWVDEKTGEITQPRKSNKRENIYDAFKLLFGIREVISDKRLSILVVYLDVEDIRSLNGYGKDRKHYSTRIERIPNKILSEILIRSAEDYSLLLPNELPDVFVASELAKAIKRTSRYTFYVLKLLQAVGAIAECGKRGRAQLYQKTKTEKQR